MRKIKRITYKWTVPSERKPQEKAAILKLRYSDAPFDFEEIELLPGEFIDLADTEERSER